MTTSETQWQPIETAPKDGTWILVCGGSPDWTCSIHTEDDLIAPASSVKWKGNGWLITLAEGGYVGVGYDNPTHWAPLPSVPPIPCRHPPRYNRQVIENGVPVEDRCLACGKNHL